MNKTVVGVVLAGGKSERMGRPKALLPLRGKTFIEHIVNEIGLSALTDCRVVVGYHAKAILNHLPNLKPISVINSDYEEGQVSSLRRGINSLSSLRVDGLMVFLVDHPFVDHVLIDALLRKFNDTETSIVIPSFQNKRGHPVIFGRTLFKELLEAPLKRGALDLIKKYQKEITYLNWESEQILIDIDTPHLYQKYIR